MNDWIRNAYSESCISKDDEMFLFSVMNEGVKSELDDNFQPKKHISLSSLKRIQITNDVINKYKEKYSGLRHVRCEDTDTYRCDGYMWLSGRELACNVGTCEYLDDGTKWIVSLEVNREYQGHGLSKQILNFAVKQLNCKYLSVNKNNKLAKKIYDDYGFKVYEQDENMYYMTLEKHPVKS